MEDAKMTLVLAKHATPEKVVRLYKAGVMYTFTPTCMLPEPWASVLVAEQSKLYTKVPPPNKKEPGPVPDGGTVVEGTTAKLNDESHKKDPSAGDAHRGATKKGK